jgi:hypothetical protein
MTLFNLHKEFPMLLTPLIFAGVASAASPDPRLLSLVPPGAQIVAGISAPAQQGQPDNFVLITHNNTVDLKDFFALTGADGTRIIHQIVFVAIGVNQGPLSEHSLLVSGHFDQPRLFRSATDGGAAVTSYRRIPVLEIQPFTRERDTFKDVRWLALPDSNVLLFGSIVSVRLELDRYLARSQTDASLLRQLAHLRSKDETWCVLSAPLRNGEIARALAAVNPALAELARSGDAFEFGLHYGRGVEFEYDATVASTEASRPGMDSHRQAPVEPASSASLMPVLNTAVGAHSLHNIIEVSMSRYKAWLAEISSARFPVD